MGFKKNIANDCHESAPSRHSPLPKENLSKVKITFQGTKIVFLFPACEVKVVRFYVSWPLLLLLLAELQLQACDRGDPSRTRTASSGSEWSLPAGPEHQAVAPAEPEQQRRTQTASSGSASRRSEWSLLDLNCKREIPVVPAGPNTKIECQIECQNRCQIGCQNRCQIESQKEWQIERENICHNIYIYMYIKPLY